MKTMVEFHTAGTAYCIPIEVARAVQSAAGMIRLPAPRPNVAGLLPGDPPLTVISPLGPAGQHVLVIEVADDRYGLLVEKVIGLRRIDEADIRLAPQGQDRELISGSITVDGQLILITDPTAMAAAL